MESGEPRMKTINKKGGEKNGFYNKEYGLGLSGAKGRVFGEWMHQ